MTSIVIPLFNRFAALDAVGPYEVLANIPGVEVVFAATTKGPVRNEPGSLAITADASLDEIDHCDVVVVPGGSGTRAMVENRALVEWLQAIHETTTWTTSVCTGSLLLGAAGILDGLPATTHWAATDLLESFGATYQPARVVEHGKVITAAGVSAGIDMALTLTARLVGDDVAKAIQLAIEYDPQPPFDCGSVAKAPAAMVELVRGFVIATGEKADAANVA